MNCFDAARRIGEIRSMLDKRIRNSEYVIGAYAMSILWALENGDTNLTIVEFLVTSDASVQIV